MSFIHQKKITKAKTSSTPERKILSFTVQESIVVPRILVYGIDRLGLEKPAYPTRNQNFELEFHSFHSGGKFYDYDGVILFQSVFESVQRNPYNTASFSISYDRHELVKRRNQTTQLLEKGGFVCFLVHMGFVTHDSSGKDASETDLCKIYSNYSDLDRANLERDCSITKVHRGEFQAFLKDYGIARVKFDYYGDWHKVNIKKICEISSTGMAGFILPNNSYFVPCRLPSKDEAEDFFTKLASALVATSKKLIQEIPEWVEGYKLPHEIGFLETEAKLQQQLDDLRAKEEVYRNYKRCLCHLMLMFPKYLQKSLLRAQRNH